MKNRKNILYLNHVSKMGGGEWSLLQLMKYIDRNKYKPILLLQEPGPLSERAEKENIETYFLKMRAWRKIKYIPLNYLLTLPKLKKFLTELNIDLIHCNAYRLNPYGVLAAKDINIPCITHVRWFVREDHIKKFCLDKTDIVVAISKYIASFFKKVDRSHIKTVYNGIYISRFKKVVTNNLDKIREEFNIESNFLVGMVAQLTPRKGHKDFIQAARFIQDKYPDVKFLVVGGDILEKQIGIDDLRKYAQEKRVKNIIFTGQRDDVENVFKSLDCFVLPSHIEPFGRVVLEAMACRVPVVATKSGGPEEIIIHGKNGLLVPVESPEDIAESVTKIIEDEKLREKLSENAYETVHEKFTIDNYVEKIQEIYTTLIRVNNN